MTGIDAVPALHGNNGETVNLEFIPSREGGFSVRGSIGKITSTTHVGVGYDLFVDARGSDGEDGGRGGDGLPGRQGPDGKDATRESDALVRTLYENRSFIFASFAHEFSSQAAMEAGEETVDLDQAAGMEAMVEMSAY